MNWFKLFSSLMNSDVCSPSTRAISINMYSNCGNVYALRRDITYIHKLRGCLNFTNWYTPVLRLECDKRDIITCGPGRGKGKWKSCRMRKEFRHMTIRKTSATKVLKSTCDPKAIRIKPNRIKFRRKCQLTMELCLIKRKYLYICLNTKSIANRTKL